jgi:Ca-activated chloride channel family protein
MGSEQHLVFDQIVRPWCEKNGLTCDAQELGSVDQANLLSDDCSNLPPYDIFWFASTVFEQIGNERCNKLVDSKPMFSSPIVFACWQHVWTVLVSRGADDLQRSSDSGPHPRR